MHKRFQLLLRFLMMTTGLTTFFLTNKVEHLKLLMWSNMVHFFLQSLTKDYPNFDRWWMQKVVPDLIVGNRTIIIVHSHIEICGISVLKHDGLEKKICCLKVHENLTRHGVGRYLFEKSFEILNTERPLLTISEINYPQFSRLFSRYGMTVVDQQYGLYQNGMVELIISE